MRSSLPILAIWLFAAVTTGLLVAIASGNARAQEESQQKPTVSKSDGASSTEMFLSKWRRGVGLRSSADPKAYIYLRFYEWNLFGAVEAGEHSVGKDRWPWEISSDQQEAVMSSDLFKAKIKAVEDGANIELTVSNISKHDWPAVAAIIPCLSPDYGRAGIPENPFFFDDEHERTYFLSPKGLELLKEREMHFNLAMKPQVLQQSQDGSGIFPLWSDRWPTSDKDAIDGFMVRESVDKTWVTGIAWDRFLTAQGHNPRRCMHLSVRVGPLKVGESRTLYGKIYLLKGTKEDCLSRFRKEFRRQAQLHTTE